MLYGGFIELLDDLVPGMWAELLNDRAFEGVGRAVKWCYYTGVPNFCDRDWDVNNTWTYDTEKPFVGSRSAKLTASKSQKATLTQQGLAVKKGAAYHFYGYFRSDSSDIQARIVLKTLLPDDTWMELGSKSLPNPGTDWKKLETDITATGTSDKVVFELEVTGSGSLWADKLSLMPSDNIKGWRVDVVEAIKAQRPGVIRWGGSLVDPGGYKWKAGIGDRDRRVPFPDPYWGRKHSNDVGIDEYLQFCELVEAEPLICISFGDGVESGRDLIEYCNGSVDTKWGGKRAENGHPEPYNVKYWQIGNELVGEEYSAGCVEFCKMIREIQPDAIILSSDPTPELFGKVGQYIDYACPHHYVPDLEQDEASIAHAVEIINQFGRAGEVKLGITEWNISAGSWGLTRGKQYTLDSAMFTGRYLNLLNRHSDVVGIACRSNMNNSYCSGMIQTNPSGLFGTPSYYTMKLYSDNHLPVPVGVEGTPEGLDISACSSDEKDAVCVFAANLTKEPIRIQLDLSGYGEGMQPVGGEVVCDTLDMRQPDIMNHFQVPDRIRTVGLAVAEDSITIPALSVAAIRCEIR